MGVKDGFMGASLMLKVALILLLLANVCSWIAFTTTSWGYIENTTQGHGLWRGCYETIGGCSPTDGSRLDWYAAVQAFGIFGFVGLSVALLLLILAMFVGSCKGNQESKMAGAILCFVAAVCWLLAVIIFGAEWPDYIESQNRQLLPVPDKFGFSFVLAIISLILAIISGILIILGGKGGGTSPA